MTKQVKAVDIASGAVVALLGVCTVVYSSRTLDLGTLYEPGAGLFPAGIGALQVLFGLAILVSGFFTTGPVPTPDLRAFAAVVAGIVIFALGITRVGLLPSTLGLCVVSTFALPKPNLKRALLISLGVSALAYLIFVKGLDIGLSLIAWSF